MKGHQASTGWISQSVKDIVKEDPTLGARKLQKILEIHYNIELSYLKCGQERNLQWMIFMVLGRRASQCYGDSKQL